MTITELQAAAAEIAAETTPTANTAKRVGSLLGSISDYLSTLQTACDTLTTAYQTADTAEAATRKAADDTLRTRIAQHETDTASAVNTLSGQITNLDSTLRSAFKQADAANLADLIAADTAEATARADADTAEATARANADTAEATARANADTALQANITALQANVQGGTYTQDGWLWPFCHYGSYDDDWEGLSGDLELFGTGSDYNIASRNGFYRFDADGIPIVMLMQVTSYASESWAQTLFGPLTYNASTNLFSQSAKFAIWTRFHTKSGGWGAWKQLV